MNREKGLSKSLLYLLISLRSINFANSRYVDYLESRVEKLEQLLRKVRVCLLHVFHVSWTFFQLPPDHDLLKELNGSLDSSEVEPNRMSADGGLLSVNALVLPTKGISLPTQRLEDGRALKEEQENDIDWDRLALSFNRVSIDYDDSGESSVRDRYYGKSSSIKLVQTAIELKEEYTGKGNDGIPGPVSFNKRQEYWGFKEVRPFLRKVRLAADSDHSGKSIARRLRRSSSNFPLMKFYRYSSIYTLNKSTYSFHCYIDRLFSMLSTKVYIAKTTGLGPCYCSYAPSVRNIWMIVVS